MISESYLEDVGVFTQHCHLSRDIMESRGRTAVDAIETNTEVVGARCGHQGASSGQNMPHVGGNEHELSRIPPPAIKRAAQ